MLTRTRLPAALWFPASRRCRQQAPVFAQRLLPSWKAPLDFGWTVRGTRLFGSHKTWRGMAAGVAAGAATFLVQRFLFAKFAAVRDLSAFDYSRHSALRGAWLGLGALTGGLFKSAAKRQMDIAPGRPWIPSDQFDWLVGSLTLGWILVDLPSGLLLNVMVVGVASPPHRQRRRPPAAAPAGLDLTSSRPLPWGPACRVLCLLRGWPPKDTEETRCSELPSSTSSLP